jgi:adenylosuccinate synthase
VKSAVVGLQWGDEGKGKIVQHLSKDHEWIVRFSGGPNAGHTIYYKGKKFVHHLIPSGSGKNKLFISRGTLVDLEVLKNEIDSMISIFPEVRRNVYVSPWCRVITPIEKELDAEFEKMKGANAIGTTKKGIGPTVANDAHRIGIRLFDFFDEKRVMEKVSLLATMYSSVIKVNAEEIFEKLMKDFENVKEFIREVKPTGDVLFESTQAIMLDPMYGTYPYVTSTPCLPQAALYYSGFEKVELETYGVFKAYATRVGSGPFPTEIFGEEADMLRKAGGEFGATTGRPRRCGWIDLPLLKYACDAADVNHLVMTKADVLNGFEKVGICEGYEGDFTPYDLENSKPKIRYVKGWKTLSDKAFEDFLAIVEKRIERKVEYVSYGPGENEIAKRN